MATFKKSKWLAQANREKELGYLSQQDIDNACETWVDELDGQEIDLNDDSKKSLAQFCE